MANLVTYGAKKARQTVSDGSKTLGRYKKAAHRNARRTANVAAHLAALGADYDDLTWDIAPITERHVS
jgi:hypothetical protein